ncbi:hypothetical protein BB559_000760 [Furculomyces boomerangus]|uniref:NADH dehydrogenase [ubiquinone] 1 alpha subcomplex subunit 13 n=2 Tax=Harpellales TaxID=61421 RepID=A0A2T9Z486_9FUNG|nr:hypothetical protein BB559_000760 [Furculomyces boomerangus]PWA03245.1 hypothetical protein BB558_000575 [Smittium angustum]
MSQTQDLPPKDGFPKISYRRNLPKKGPTGIVILSGIAAMMTFGWYRVYQGLTEKRELEREKMWGRINILPLLTAETDRDEYRRSVAALNREKEIMKDVVGWPVGKSIYNTNRYVPPMIPNIPADQRPQ